MCNIEPKTLPCGTPALMSFTSQYTSFIFTTMVLLFRHDLSKWRICSGKCFLIVCKRLSWFTLSNAFSMSMKRAVQYCFFSIASKISLTNLCICSHGVFVSESKLVIWY